MSEQGNESQTLVQQILEQIEQIKSGSGFGEVQIVIEKGRVKWIRKSVSLSLDQFMTERAPG